MHSKIIFFLSHQVLCFDITTDIFLSGAYIFVLCQITIELFLLLLSFNSNGGIRIIDYSEFYHIFTFTSEIYTYVSLLLIRTLLFLLKEVPLTCIVRPV